MSSSSKGRKKPNRTASKKSMGQNQIPPFDGAYGNQRLVHVLLSLMGKKCQTKVRNGHTYEGIFHTFNQKMDIAVNAVHLCNNPDQSLSSNGIDERGIENGFPKEEELIAEMKFPTENFVCARFEDVDLNFAVLEVNEPNGDMMNQQRNSMKGGEKKLEPWNGGGDSAEADSIAIGGLESSGLEGTNGWDANEMFKANEEKYGVVSDYDSSLSSYTMRLDIKETEEDSERVLRATRLAQEIESSSDYRHRVDMELDDGVTEEDKFSAVTRDQRRDGRGPRDMRDRDGEYGGHRGDKDRGDRDPSSPQGYRGSKHSDFDQRSRNRGRGREWTRNSGYSNQSMSSSRPVGMSGGPPGGGRNQPMSQIDGGPQVQGGQSKTYRNPPANLPPRFSKSGSQGHSRDEERMRQSGDSGSMHSPYQAPKGQRSQRIPRSNGGRWPTSPPSDYPHQSTQMHQDPAVVSSGPSSGGPLSRTSSSSSNTSAPVQNHRKHLSTSSQEDQPQHPGQHHPHMRQVQSSSSPTGGPVISSLQQASPRPQPIQPGGPAHQESPSWASVARGNQKDVSPPAIRQLQSGSNLPPGSQLSWKPPPTTQCAYPSTVVPGSMTPRAVHHGPQMQQQMMASAQQQPQQNVAASAQQQQAMMAERTMTQLHPQQSSMSSMQPNSRIPQPSVKPQPATLQEPAEQMDKNEDNKVVPKKMAGPPQNVSIKSRNDGSIKELQEFRHNFKLSTDVNKDQLPASNKPQQRQQPPNVGPQQQPSSGVSRPQPYPNSAGQQQTFQHQTQLHSAYPPSMTHQEHGMPAQHALGQSPVQMAANQVTVQQPKPHPQSVSTHVHHPQTMTNPHMSQQIPMASPGIQQFASNVPPQAAMQQVSPRQIENRRMLPPVDKPGLPVLQKPLTSPKSDVSNFNINGNVHVVTGKPVSQTTPSAVISVSAAAPSPLVTTQYHPVTVTANSQTGQQPMKQSPTTVQVASSPSSTPSIEQATNQPPATSVSSANTVTSPSAGKPLNPEAMEFKPRTPAKPAPTAARAATPLQPGFVATYQPQVIPQSSQLVGPMYNTVQPLDAMQPVPPMYQTLPQQFLITPPVVPPMHGQQMQQFAAFDQGAPVYTGPAPQPMMPQNARMAAMPATPQQHVQQYPPDQSPNAVYAVPVPQQTNFMQQARPHSAHTPTKVTAASPAGQSTQQAPQQTGQTAQAMVQGPGGQQQMWMMVPPAQIPHQHMNQAPPNAPFMSVVSTPMPSTVAQQKVPQQAMQYMPQHPNRPPYAQFQSSAPSNQ